ncbi:MAG TPA: alpha/beta hydrolase family protein [Gemmatimonadaceae bacterium]|nr:alpha/beta hydrolase family protein [Gemmatimonadaceae bacterium]
MQRKVVLLLSICTSVTCTGGAGPRAATTTATTPAIGPASTPEGHLVMDSLWSPALGVWKRMVVYLPPSYESSPRRRYPVAYYLHGMWGSETDWTTQGHIAAVADSLAAAGVPEMIIVMPDGDNGYYTTWATPGDYEACRRQPPVREPPHSYCVRRPHYDEYVAFDVVRHVDSAHRTRAEPARRAVAGLSMGGYGAITLALRYPEIWSAAASHSGVLSIALVGRAPDGAPQWLNADPDFEPLWGADFWPLIAPVFGRDTADWWAREPARLASIAEARGRLPAMLIDVGVDDSLVIDRNRAFRDRLAELGIAHTYREWPGGHTWSYWRAHVGESLRWIAGHIGR